jgi:hypothetical protein
MEAPGGRSEERLRVCKKLQHFSFALDPASGGRFDALDFCEGAIDLGESAGLELRYVQGRKPRAIGGRTCSGQHPLLKKFA